MKHISGLIRERIEDQDKGANYHAFSPHRRAEEFAGIAGPHDGLALPHDVLRAIAESRASGKPHQYLVRGEWVRRDGVRFLDIGVDVQWIVAQDPGYVLEGGFVRWVCPGCGRRLGHGKGCEYR